MIAGRSNRGPVRIRRRGRHTAPSQVEKVAQQAGRAAPAVAIAGALVTAPQVSHTATVQGTIYQVRSGDTLSTLANRFFHNNDWQYLYHENAKTISDPDVIHAGQRLFIPASAPAHYALSGYVPRHAKRADGAAARTPVAAQAVSPGSGHDGGRAVSGGSAVVQSAAQGQYSCSSLEQLWEQAGGSAGEAVMAAEIAMAESGGNPNAISPTDDFGLWQINASNGALATLDPFQNAKSAVALSDDGANWGPWTTFTSGTYSGKC